MIFLSIPLVVVFFMLGGQLNKLFRPIGVPLSLLGCSCCKLEALPVLWYAFSLTLGYGVDSKLMKVLKSEQKVRIVSGLLNAVPVAVITSITHQWWDLIGIPLIVGVWCIRLGKWGSINSFDILPVDILRGAALSAAIINCLL